METTNENRSFPQVLLLGNGLNRAYDGDSWGDLLEKVWSKDVGLTYEECKEVPYPLRIVLGTQDHVEETIKEYKKALCSFNNFKKLRHALEPIWDTGFDHILTTNYSYELEFAANSDGMCKKDGENKCSSSCSITKCKHHTDSVERADTKYLLHTYNSFSCAGKEQKIWHIHGEARKSNSIIIGHYYYGKLMEKIQRELDKRRNRQFENQRDDKPIIMDSWLDAFIMGDVYMLGFGCDLSEMDMWWLINRKKRENAEHGRTLFYEPRCDGTKAKHALLKALNVEVRHLGFENTEGNGEYQQFYTSAIADIQNEVKHTRRDVEACPNLSSNAPTAAGTPKPRRAFSPARKSTAPAVTSSTCARKS